MAESLVLPSGCRSKQNLGNEIPRQTHFGKALALDPGKQNTQGLPFDQRDGRVGLYKIHMACLLADRIVQDKL